jgi:hypothetical protein
MSIKNSIKLLLNNFSTVWKILIYQIIVFAVSLALLAGFVLPNLIYIYNSVSGTGLFQNAINVANAFLERGDLTQSIEAFKVSLESASAVMAENASRLVLSYLFIFIILIFSNLLSGMSGLAVSDMINGDMSANAKYGFMSRFIITMGKNIKYQLARLVTEIPAYIVIAFCVWQCFSLLFNYIGIFSLFFAFALLIIMLSFMQAFFCLWLPQITVEGTKIFPSIAMGVKKIKPHYLQTVSGFAFINVFLVFMNMMLAFFTCGAGLLLSVPMSTFFIIIYRLVVYYDINGLKYYVDSNTIISPKELL